MTNIDSILKSRDVTLPTKLHLVKAMVFPVVMYGCKSWTIKKAECKRIDSFELWCWKKTLESPLDCKEIYSVHPKGNQSWIFIGKTDVEPKLQYFSNLMQRANSFEKALMLGKIEGRRTRGWQMMRCLDGTTGQWTWVWVNSSSWWRTAKPGVLQSTGSQRVRRDWAMELDWT